MNPATNPATNPAIDTLHALRDNWAAGGDMGRPDGFVAVREGVDGGAEAGEAYAEAYAVKIELWTDDCLMDLKKQDEAAARRRGEALAKKWAKEHWPHTGYVDLGGAEGVYGATWAWDKATENELERTDPDEVVRLPAARANPAARKPPSRKPLDKDLYEAVKEEAKRKFDVWPSAYASGWVVKTYKARGGRYAGGDLKTRSGLTKWFGEEWVDLSRLIHDEDGELVGYEPCGRKASDDPAAYPKCRPLAEALRMSPSEVKDAVKRKRAAEAKAAKGRGGRGARAPVRVATYRANPDAAARLGPVVDTEEWDDGTVVEFVAVPFPVERKPLSYKDDPEVSGFVRVEDLIATQRRVTKAGVEKYLDDLAGRVGRAEKIRVYETHDGRRYIADGHHRAVAAWAAGVEVLPAVIQLVRENPTADLRSNPEAPTEGQTPDGLAWALEEGGEVTWKTDMEVDTFVRVTNRKGKTVCGVYTDRHGDTLYVEYAVVFDPKLRRKGVYSDVLEGLSEHYNIVSDQDHNNAAASIYKRLGAQYSSRDERYTLRKKTDLRSNPTPRSRRELECQLDAYGLDDLVRTGSGTLYHGTTRQFQRFDMAYIRHDLIDQFYKAPGIFLTPRWAVAEQYAEAARNALLSTGVIADLARKNRGAGEVLARLVHEGRAAWGSLYADAKAAFPDARNGPDALEQMTAGVDPNTLLDIAMHIEGSRYAEAPQEETLFDLWSGAVKSTPSWVFDTLDLAGLDSSEYRPKVYTVEVFGLDRVLVTQSKEKAEAAKANGYDAVVFCGGADLIDGVPEVVVFNPSKVKVTKVEVVAPATRPEGLDDLNSVYNNSD